MWTLILAQSEFATCIATRNEELLEVTQIAQVYKDNKVCKKTSARRVVFVTPEKIKNCQRSIMANRGGTDKTNILVQVLVDQERCRMMERKSNS